MAAAAAGDEWQRPLDDPFGSDAVDIITRLTPSPAARHSSHPEHIGVSSHQPAERDVDGEDGGEDDGDAFMRRLDASAHALRPQSRALSSAASTPFAPLPGPRPTIYEEDEEAHCSSQEDTEQRPLLRCPATPRFPSASPFRIPAPSASAPSAARLLQRTPATGKRSDRSQQVDRVEAVHQAERAVVRPARIRPESPAPDGESAEQFPDPFARPGGGGEDGGGLMELGFTSGSGKRVAVSAAAFARGAQMMREVEEEEETKAQASLMRAASGDDDAPLQSINSATNTGPRFPAPTPSPQSAAMKSSALRAPASGFKTPARPARPVSSSTTPRRPLPTSEGASPLLSAAFNSARGTALPPVSAAMLATAKELMDREGAEAEAEFARVSKRCPPTPFTVDGGTDGAANSGAGLVIGFSTGRGKAVIVSEETLSNSRKRFPELLQPVHEEEEERPRERAAEESAALQPAMAGWTSAVRPSFPALRPPSSSFKAPARQAPRVVQPIAGIAPMVDAPSAAASPARGDSVRPQPRARKSEQFEAFMAALSAADSVNDALSDAPFLPPPIPSDSVFAAAGADESDPAVGFHTAAAAATVDGAESDDFPTYSASSTGSSSSPFTPPERQLRANQCLPTDAQGGFHTATGHKVNFAADSWAKGQRLIDSVDNELSKDALAGPHGPLLSPALRRPLAPIDSALNARSARDEQPLLTKRAKENVPVPFPQHEVAVPPPPAARPSPPLSAAKSAPRPFRPPVAIARPSLIDSPLPSPSTGFAHRHPAQRRPPMEDGDASNAKKRRLAFNTPRAHVTPNTVVRVGHADGGDEEPNLLKSAKKARAKATALQREINKHADLSAPVPPLPSLDPPPSLLPFRVRRHVIEQHNEDELLALGLPEEVVRMTATAALSYTLPPSDSSGGVRLSAVHVYHHLVQLGCDPSLFSLLWVRNHWRWVVWKLAAYERAFPSVLAGRCLTYFQVMRQIKRRYDRELDQVKRSALALILERDESASRYLVLCIAAIIDNDVDTADDLHMDEPDTTILLHKAAAFRATCHLVLTDGHYSVPAKLDPPLLSLLHQGRLRVGCTVRVFNASLGGGADAVTPLENDSVYLELRANSVRRGRPGCMLGFQRTSTFSVSLRGVVEGGGGLPCVHAAVGRVYPMLFMEMMEDGTKLHRTQRAEEAADEQWRQRMDNRMEQRRMEWEASMEKANASNGSQCGGLSSTFSSSPRPSPSSSSSMYHDEMVMEEEPVEPRKVIPYIKVRLHEVVPPGATPPLPRPDGGEVADNGEAKSGEGREIALLSGSECMFTVWRPSEADLEMLVEGAVVSIYGAQVSGRFNGVLRLANSRSTPIVRMQSVGPFPSLYRRAVPFIDLQTLQAGDEFDCAMNVVYESRHASPVSSTTTRHLFGIHDAEELLMVEVVESPSLILLPVNALQLPLVALFTGLEYGNYDRVRRVHVAHATVMSQVRMKGGGGGDGGDGRKALLSAWSQCREWFDTMAGEQVRSMQRERVRRLVEGDAVDGGSGETEDWYADLRRAIVATETEKAQRLPQPVNGKQQQMLALKARK